jgi:pimeloyl-ACP methyl ester carboxylesterase
MATRLYRVALLLIGLASLIVAAALTYFLGLNPVLALGLSAAMALGIHAGILGIEFILAAILNKNHPLPDGYPVSGGGNGLLAWLVEVPSAWRTFAWAIPWRSGAPLASGSDPAKVALLFVHGFTCNQSIWQPMARYFADLGHPTAGVDLEPLEVSIDQYGEQIDAAVNALIKRTGQSQVALIGHSMGGLAIRAYCRDYGSGAVRQVITLGSPHNGTWITRLARSPNTKELSLDSEWLAKLAANENDQTGALYSTITSIHDNIVFPAVFQPIPGSRAAFIRGIGHVDMLYRQSVWQSVLDELSAKDK